LGEIGAEHLGLQKKALVSAIESGAVIVEGSTKKKITFNKSEEWAR
jgi:hypothetical protein